MSDANKDLLGERLGEKRAAERALEHARGRLDECEGRFLDALRAYLRARNQSSGRVAVPLPEGGEMLVTLRSSENRVERVDYELLD